MLSLMFTIMYVSTHNSVCKHTLLSCKHTLLSCALDDNVHGFFCVLAYLRAEKLSDAGS